MLPSVPNCVSSRNVRNISIIAHVDHGKTSMSDCLLQFAGQLSEKRLGECALDSLDEERARGITIASSSVALLLPMAHDVLEQGRANALARLALVQVPESNVPDMDEGSVELHVANLPFHCTEDAVLHALKARAQDLGGSIKVRVRSKRGSAAVLVDSLKLADALIGRVEINNVVSVVSKADDNGIMRHVNLVASRQSLPMPTFVVQRDESTQEFVCNDAFRGLTRRSARHATAAAWLDAHAATLSVPPSERGAEALPPLKHDAHGILINLIDSPGHVDFTAEVSAALRLTDGSIVLCDAVSGPAAQTNSVLRQALREQVAVVLMLNKVDRAINEQQLSPTDLCHTLQQSVDAVNATLGDAHQHLAFERGSVAIGSAKEGWAVTLESVLQLYAERASADELLRLRARLTGSRTSKKAFIDLVLGPIYRLRSACDEGHADVAFDFLTKVGRAPTGHSLAAWRELVDAGNVKGLRAMAMRALFPLAPAIVDMAVRELPSPLEAQRTRASIVYNVKDEHDVSAPAIVASIADCDTEAGAMVYCAKQVTLGTRKYVLSRVLSGTLEVGSVLRCLPADGSSEMQGKISSIAVVISGGRGVSRVERAEAGSIVLISGLPLVHGTATSIADAHALTGVCSLVSHVVGMAIRVNAKKAKGDAPKRLADGLQALTAADPSLLVKRNTEGEVVLMGAGMLHLDVSLSRLETMIGMPLDRSPPVVSMQETVVAESRIMLGKSSNKHNRVFASAEPMDADWLAALAAMSSDAFVSDGQRRAALTAAGVSTADVRRILCFGTLGDNIVIDRTTGISVAPIADSLRQAFHGVEAEGVLARGQRLTGVAIILHDLKYHADANHRGPAQIVPAATTAFTAALLGASPRLVEPMMLAEISSAVDCINDVYAVLHSHRADCEDAVSDSRGFVTVSARLGVRNTFTLSEEIRAATKGCAFPSLNPQGWRIVGEADMLEIVDQARARNNLPLGIPEPTDDRL